MHNACLSFCKFQTMKASLILPLISLSLLATSCSKPPEAAAQTKLVLTGSSTVAPLVTEIAKRYESQNPGVRIDVQTGGSSRGIADARQGVANIGMVSRALKDGEKDLQSFAIAKDGISVIINRDNPVKSLTDQQIVDIYTKKINNWKQVGGKDAPITVVNKAEGRSTLELFAEHYKLKNTNIRADVIIGDNEQGIKTISGNPNAIAYVSIGSAEYATTNKTPIKLLPANGIEASIITVGKGTFPISRPLNLVTKTIPNGLAQDFINYARSKHVQDIIEKQYFVPVTK